MTGWSSLRFPLSGEAPEPAVGPDRRAGERGLTISNWRKKAGKTISRKKAGGKAKVGKAGGDPWTQMVALKKDMEIMEKELAAKKAEFRKLAARL
jgi:hypothetical protein